MGQNLELRVRVTGVAQFDLTKPILPPGLDTGRVFITLVPVVDAEGLSEGSGEEEIHHTQHLRHILTPGMFEPPNPMVIYMSDREYSLLGSPSVGEELLLKVGLFEKKAR